MDIYTVITDRIITALEQGTVPWHKPWTCVNGAVSHVTGSS